MTFEGEVQPYFLMAKVNNSAVALQKIARLGFSKNKDG
jgi:hypothetical protein